MYSMGIDKLPHALEVQQILACSRSSWTPRCALDTEGLWEEGCLLAGILLHMEVVKGIAVKAGAVTAEALTSLSSTTKPLTKT